MQYFLVFKKCFTLQEITHYQQKATEFETKCETQQKELETLMDEKKKLAEELAVFVKPKEDPSNPKTSSETMLQTVGSIKVYELVLGILFLFLIMNFQFL